MYSKSSKFKFYIISFFLFFSIFISTAFAGKSNYAKGEILFKTKGKSSSYTTASTSNTNNIINNKLTKKFKIKSVKELFKKTSKKQTNSNIKTPNFNLSNIYKANFSKDIDPEEVAKEFAQDPNIEYAQPNYKRELCKTPNDSDFDPEQWGLHNTDDKDIDAPEAWDIETGSKNIIVAIVDTGVDYNHVDIQNNMWINSGETTSNSIDDDNNGFIDDTIGWDFSGNTEVTDVKNISPDNDPQDMPLSATDGGHGTHCAGIVGAEGNNGIGVTGVCWNITIMPVKAFPNSYDEVLSNAIIYAADNGAHVISNSWGSVDPSPVILDAIKYAQTKGCTLFFAAGNDGNSTPYYPAYYDEGIAVAATERNDKKAGFSNYGTWVDISAPGDYIYSLEPGNGYVYESGTSMACPIAAGAAAIILSKYPNLSNTRVRKALLTNCDNIDSLNPAYYGQLGAGRINLYSAIISVDVIAPTMAISVNSGNNTLPQGSGPYTVSMTITEASSIISTPDLYFTLPDGTSKTIPLTGHDKSWTGSLFVESVYRDTATFHASCYDISENKGTSITSGEHFYIISSINSNSGIVSNSDGTKVVVSNSTFSEDVFINIAAPSTTDNTLATANSKLPVGKSIMLIEEPNLVRSFSAESASSGSEITGNFNKEVTIYLSYPDTDNNGIVDNTSISEDDLKVFYLNPLSIMWEKIPNTYLNKTENNVSFNTNHFSTYALLAVSEPKILNSVRVFPNPCITSNSNNIKFSNIPKDLENVELYIFTISGELVYKTTETASQYNVKNFEWNLKNQSNEKVASGLYIYLITTDNTIPKSGKICIVK